MAVSAVLQVDGAQPQTEGIISSVRNTSGERLGSDMFHAAGQPGPISNPLPTAPDFIKELRDARERNKHNVLNQLYSETIESELYNKMTKYAAENGLTIDEAQQMLVQYPHLAKHFFTDPIKQSIHERLSYEYCAALALHQDSPLQAVAQLPRGGDTAMYHTSKGVKHGKDLTGKLRAQCSSFDLLATLNGWVVYQFHKYTFEEGGSQNRGKDDVLTYATSSRKYGQVEGPLHIDMDPTQAPHKALYVAVVDGPYWTDEYRKEVKRAGKAVDVPTEGGFMVCSTADLAALYETIASL
jgi:hypothetical protein